MKTSETHLIPAKQSTSHQDIPAHQDTKVSEANKESNSVPADRRITLQDIPKAPKEKLEDILNELMSQEGIAVSSPRKSDKSGLSTQTPQVQFGQLSFSASDSKKGLPTDIRCQLKLPPNPDGVFQSLKTFQQQNRQNPLITTSGGKVIYVEYDFDMERIRLFIGSKEKFLLMPVGVREQSGFLVIEEVYEYKLETSTREIFGFKRTEQRVLERYKTGAGLLSARECAEKQVQPILYFSSFNDKSSGISSNCIRIEKFRR